MSKTCFFVSRIGDPGSPEREFSDKLLKYIIEPALEQCGYEKPVRADHITQPGVITTQVFTHLWNDDLVIADLTGGNPNVFYELAVRHIRRKPFVHLIQSGNRIPFDLAPNRTIQFDFDIAGARSAIAALEAMVRASLESPATLQTPLSVALDALGVVPVAPATLRAEPIVVNVVLLRDQAYNIAPIHHAMLLDNVRSGYGYSLLSDVVGFWRYYYQGTDIPELHSEKGTESVALDIIEAAFWRWMSIKYPMHWDMEIVPERGIHGYGESGHPRPGAEEHPRLVTQEEVGKCLDTNIFFKGPHLMLLGGTAALPSEAVISFERGWPERAICIRTDHIEKFRIVFTARVWGDIGYTVLAEKLKAKYSPGLLHNHIVVLFEYAFSPTSELTENGQRQSRWLRQLIANYRQDFEWSLIEDDLKRAL